MTPIQVLISSISTPTGENALRTHTPEDKKEWEKTLALKADIAERGLRDLFSVRPIGDDKYEVINGSRRVTAIKLLHEEGHPRFQDGTIFVNVVDVDEYESLADQIATNYHMNKTVKAKEIRAIQRIALAKGLNMAETATRVGMSEQYLTKLFKITNLPDKVQELVDKGEMSLGAAIQLSKLPADQVDSFVADAVALPVAELTAKIAQAMDEYKKALRAGKPEATEFSATPIFIGKADIESKYNEAQAAYDLDANDYNKGRLDVLKEIFSQDDATLADRRAEWEAEKAKKEADKEQRAAARDNKRLEDAKKLLAEAGIPVG